jgi:predicted SAM-dependent methyltransferase
MGTCLEIGPDAGRKLRTGWDTLDMQPGCTFRARWGFERLPIAEAAYDLVFASHVLEHVPWFYARASLAEVLRILRPNGVFEVWVPDFAKIVKAYLDGTICDDNWLPLNPERDLWKSLNGRLFWGARKGEIGREQHFHRACFDEASLKMLLSQAGFGDIQRATRPPGAGHGWVELGLTCRKCTVDT